MSFGFGLGFPRARSASLEAAIAALFPDVWYDPSSMETLYQDSAGTTPVTAVEQAVGLMLDKSKGLVLGSELVTNGGFDTDTSWTKGTGWSIPGGYAAVNNTSGSNQSISQTLSGTNGKTYLIRVSVTARSGAGSLFVYWGNAAQANMSAPGEYQFIVTLTLGSNNIFITAGNGVTASIDNISVRELPGNHAYHTPGDTTTRPVLSRRINLLTKTEQFDDAAWTKNSTTITANAVVSPDGTTTADIVTHTAASGELINAGSISELLVAGKYTFSTYVKYVNNQWLRFVVGTGVPNNNCSGWFDIQNGIVGSTINTGSATNAAISIQNVGNGWYRCSLTGTLPTGSTTGYVSIMAAASDASNTRVSGGAWSCWGASLVPADLASLPYQRVNTATDYDSDASKFPSYLRCDGVNDSLQTNAIDFTATDKMFVSAGVRKLSDAAQGTVAELSSSIVTNNGTWVLFAPPGAGATTVQFRSRGDGTAGISGTDAIAPVTGVLTGIGNISGDSAILRLNGTQAAAGTADQGTGNYGNYPLYLFRRGGSSLPFNGWFYGSVIKGATLTAAQIAIVEQYLATKTKTVSLA